MNRICTIEGCNKKVHAKGLCSHHYNQNRNVKCQVDGCDSPVHGHGYCRKHLDRLKKYGDPLHRRQRDPNEIVLYDDYAEIILYDADNKECARTIIDLDDVDKVKDIKWCTRGNDYVGNKKVGLLHRFLMDCPENMDVDHWNHNKLDNRKSNLRVCTRLENNWNQEVYQNNTSGFKGVHYQKQDGKYRAYISHQEERINIGVFKTAEMAAMAYDLKAIELFGEYAHTNHPIEDYIALFKNKDIRTILK